MLDYNGFALLSLDNYNGHVSFRFDEYLAQNGSITCPVCGEGKTVNIAVARTNARSLMLDTDGWSVKTAAGVNSHRIR